MQNDQDEPQEYWVSTHLKHLEMLQNVINRMTVASSQTKVASIGIATAVISLAAAISTPSVILFTVPVVLMLAALDAYHLWLERGFRSRFDEVRQQPITGPANFNMAPDKSRSFWSTVSSPSVFLFYASLMALAIAAFSFIDTVPMVECRKPT